MGWFSSKSKRVRFSSKSLDGVVMEVVVNAWLNVLLNVLLGQQHIQDSSDIDKNLHRGVSRHAAHNGHVNSPSHMKL